MPLRAFVYLLRAFSVHCDLLSSLVPSRAFFVPLCLDSYPSVFLHPVSPQPPRAFLHLNLPVSPDVSPHIRGCLRVSRFVSASLCVSLRLQFSTVSAPATGTTLPFIDQGRTIPRGWPAAPPLPNLWLTRTTSWAGL